MSLDNIYNGDYGQPIELTIKDVDTNGAANISAYTTKQMIFRGPGGTEAAKEAVFATDGTDGRIRYTPEAEFLTGGRWRVRGRVSIDGTAQLTTEWHEFLVGS